MRKKRVEEGGVGTLKCQKIKGKNLANIWQKTKNEKYGRRKKGKGDDRGGGEEIKTKKKKKRHLNWGGSRREAKMQKKTKEKSKDKKAPKET